MAIFYEDVLRAFQASNVRYVVVGGTAVILHGVPRTTADLDVVVDLAADNVERLVSVLRDQGYRARAPVDPELLASDEARRSWFEEKGMRAFSFWHPERPLDALERLEKADG
ncbi:MAG: hypothetical protein AAFQ65_07975 [Myxococcota bacterium]